MKEFENFSEELKTLNVTNLLNKIQNGGGPIAGSLLFIFFIRGDLCDITMRNQLLIVLSMVLHIYAAILFIASVLSSK